MAVIDAEGLFEGDRFDLMSDEARLIWPFFWCASNTVGRIELNFNRFAKRAFGRFHKRPDEELFWRYIDEYRKAFLLFVYQAPDGSIWGQWDADDRFLPTYKLKADEASPAPNKPQFEAWRQEYRRRKAERLRSLIEVTVVGNTNNLQALNGIPENSRNFENISYREGIGRGIGTGSGTLETSSTKTVEGGDAGASNSASAELPTEPVPVDQQQSPPEVIDSRTQRSNGPQSAAASTKPKAANASAALSGQQDTWFEKEFWPKRWRPEGKQDALKAFRKVATTEKAKTELMQALEEQRPEYLAREQSKRPYMSTWLNSRRYEDQVELIAPIPVQPVGSAAGVSATPGDRRSAQILDMVGNG